MTYKILKNFTGSMKYQDVLITYKDGYTVYIVSDDIGLLFYREPNFAHPSYKVKMNELKEAVGKAKSPKLIPSEHGLIVKTRVKETVVPSQFVEEADIEWPVLPKKQDEIDFATIFKTYKQISFFHKATLDDCQVIISPNDFAIRNHTSEIIQKIDTGFTRSVAISFPVFAHTIKAFGVTNPEKIVVGYSSDLYFATENMIVIMPFYKDPITYLFTNIYYCGNIKMSCFEHNPKVLIKNETLYIGDIAVGPAKGRMNKILSKNKLHTLCNKLGNEFEVYIMYDSIVLKKNNTYTVFF